ncbi:MAG: 3-methyl-2-oxobutanoate hydroxymethyltransferase [Actinomycetota bacterium]|nr:3-methyl-2-oxobutanoate hydroxymethyltransferase [Actinomycetota bacterium]
MSRLSVSRLANLSLEDAPLAGLTGYSYTQAVALEQAGIDYILVGDSGGMVELGFPSTRSVLMSDMLRMAESVRRGAPHTFLVGDMPLGSYEPSDAEAVRSAIDFVRFAGVDAVKLEGGSRVESRVRAIANAGIAVIGHIGVTPQSPVNLTGYRVHGKIASEFSALVEDARALFTAGASAILLEAIPHHVSAQLNRLVSGTFLGIGAGRGLAGQLLILHDVLGQYPDFRPKFAKNYGREIMEAIVSNSVLLANVENEFISQVVKSETPMLEFMKACIRQYILEVRSGEFPSEEFEYPISDTDLQALESSAVWQI